MALFDREKSLTRAVIYYTDRKPQVYYSYLQYDKRGKQFGVDQLRKMILSMSGEKYTTALIYDNQNTNALGKSILLHKFIAGKEVIETNVV